MQTATPRRRSVNASAADRFTVAWKGPIVGGDPTPRRGRLASTRRLLVNVGKGDGRYLLRLLIRHGGPKRLPAALLRLIEREVGSGDDPAVLRRAMGVWPLALRSPAIAAAVRIALDRRIGHAVDRDDANAVLFGAATSRSPVGDLVAAWV